LPRFERAWLLWAAGFALCVYLAIDRGGFFDKAHDGAAAALCLILLAGAVIGLLPAVRLTRSSWIALGLFGGFVLWSALGIPFSDGVERSFTALPLLGLYLAVLAIGVMSLSGDALPRVIGVVASAIAVVALLALLFRLRPEWFPADTTIQDLPDAGARLKFPLGYWNGLAGLLAMGIPLFLAAATAAGRRWCRVAAAVAVPLCALAIHWTVSRGGILTALAAVAVFLILHPRPLATLPTLAVIGAGCLLLVAQGVRLSELADLAPGFESQQFEMAFSILVVSGLVVAGMLAVLRLEERWRAPSLAVTHENARRVLGGVAALAALIVVGLLATGTLQDAWEGFTEEDTAQTTRGRLTDVSGNLRYQQWETAVDAAGDSPLLGTGADTFEYSWLEEGVAGAFSPYAHSLYMQSLAETGIVGFILIIGFILFAVVVAIRRALAHAGGQRAWLAGAGGLIAAFALAMVADWGWYMPAIVVPFLIVVAAVLQTRPSPGDTLGERPRDRRRLLRVALGAAAIPLIAVSVAAWIYADRIDASQDATKREDFDAALDAAASADSVVPKPATAYLQRALVLEAQGKFDEANEAAVDAVNADENNWRTWFTLSRIQEQKGDTESGREYFERAEQLNPRSPIFLNNEEQSALSPGTAEGE
jgi:hypothetical protein